MTQMSYKPRCLNQMRVQVKNFEQLNLNMSLIHHIQMQSSKVLTFGGFDFGSAGTSIFFKIFTHTNLYSVNAKTDYICLNKSAHHDYVFGLGHNKK